MTDRFFFWGTLRHPPLLRAVLGRDAATLPATLPGWHAAAVDGHDFPTLVPAPGAAAQGVLVADLTAADRARLDFYEGGFGYAAQPLPVRGADGQTVTAQVFLDGGGGHAPGDDWQLDAWVARWGPTVVATAADTMALFGRSDAAAVGRRRAVMLVRGAARARAAAGPAPAALRRAAAPADIAVADRRQPYADFFAVEEYDVAFRRFDGRMSAPVTRTAFVSGDAVVVLPYDPVRDRVLVVEQFRVGAHARGDPNPWSLEGIAGRADPGETPQDTARREAVEEAGVTLGDLLAVHDYYPSPGAKTEFLYTYVALCDLPDDRPRLGGLPGEGEDIRSHVIPFDRLMQLVATGEVNNGPLILLALWLQRERAGLRARAGI